MHCLWLTLADPDPATNGQLIYSKGLIEAARDAGATLRVIGLARRESPRSVCDLLGIDWRLAEEQTQSPWRRLLSPMPVVAQRGNAPNMKRLLDEALAERPWDADRLRQHQQRLGARGRGAPSPAEPAAAARRLPLPQSRGHGRRAASPRLPVACAVWRRRSTISRSGGWSAGWSPRPTWSRRIRPTIAAGSPRVPRDVPLSSCRPDMPVRGSRPARSTTSVPRRAILVSSLDLPPKRAAVEAFLADATAMLAREGHRAAGRGRGRARLSRDSAAALSHRSISSAGSTMSGPTCARRGSRWCRISWAASSSRGWTTCSIACRSSPCALPCRACRWRTARTSACSTAMRRMADGVVELIDDFPRLNAWQAAAYDACADRFDWLRIGHHLVQHLAKAERLSPTARKDASRFAAASRSAHLAAGR